jgi:hypothetical protein
MRIAIYVKLANRSGNAMQITFWESLNVSGIEQAKAHAKSVYENNQDVTLSFFNILED